VAPYRVGGATQANTPKTLLSGKLGRCTARGWRCLRRCPPPFSLTSGRMGSGTGHTSVAPSRMRRCTSSAAAVPSPTQLAPGQVQVGTTLGVAVPPDRVVVPLGQPATLGLPAGHGAPDKGWRCPRGSIPSRVSSPFLHLSHHLCKCASTPSVSPSRASVLAFSQTCFKGYSLLTECALSLKCICMFSNT
jgi:hypothetical protein